MFLEMAGFRPNSEKINIGRFEDECAKRIAEPLLVYLKKRNPSGEYFVKSYHDFLDGNAFDSIMVYLKGFLGFKRRVASIDVMTSKKLTTYGRFKSFCPGEISDVELEEFIVGFDLPKILSTQIKILQEKNEK